MAMVLNKLGYTDLVLVPKTDNVELSRFYHKVYDIFNRMSGNSTDGERIVTVDDLNSSLLTPTRWRDFNVGAISLGKGAAAPDDVKYAGTNIYMPAFDGNATTEELHGAIELDHLYREGSDIFFHVHWLPTTATAGNVVWQVEYVILRSGFVLTAGTTIRQLQSAGGVQWKHNICELPKIPGTNLRIGDQFIFRFFRNPTYNSGGIVDTYPDDAVVATVGLHVQVDGFGSKSKFTKG